MEKGLNVLKGSNWRARADEAFNGKRKQDRRLTTSISPPLYFYYIHKPIIEDLKIISLQAEDDFAGNSVRGKSTLFN